MPIYMDRHDIAPGTSSEQVAEAHIEDVKLQHLHGCKAITYWFDEERSSVFCLFDAPSKKAVKDLHANSHGLMPNQIMEVDKEIVNGFLGRIDDPEGGGDINESAFRVIMFTDLKDSTRITADYGDKLAMDLLRVHNTIIRQKVAEFTGRDIKHTGDGFMISFSSVSKAVECSIAVQKAFYRHNEENKETPLLIRIGLSAGEPVTDSGDLFGATIQLAARICDFAEAASIMTASVIYELSIGKNISFVDRGEVRLKGFETSTHVYEVDWKN